MSFDATMDIDPALVRSTLSSPITMDTVDMVMVTLEAVSMDVLMMDNIDNIVSKYPPSLMFPAGEFFSNCQLFVSFILL